MSSSSDEKVPPEIQTDNKRKWFRKQESLEWPALIRADVADPEACFELSIKKHPSFDKHYWFITRIYESYDGKVYYTDPFPVPWTQKMINEFRAFLDKAEHVIEPRKPNISSFSANPDSCASPSIKKQKVQ